jgi:DNA polymerase II small subunit/DNA polymerase delta subunit B
MLFHGTKKAGIQGIKEFGFDSRYFNNTGYYGRGAYFADVPEKSDDYTERNDDGVKQMFIVKVALGTQEVLTSAANNKLGPSKGYHSILGQAGKHN